MKRITFLFLVLILVSTSEVAAQEVEIGSILHILERDRMKVVNPESITNDSDFQFEFQDPCVVHRTGKLKVKEKAESDLLVEYMIEGKNYLGSCPSGALFNITEEKFRAMDRRYYETRDRLDLLW